MKPILLLTLFSMCASLLIAETGKTRFPSAESILNAFIATYAKESRYLKKDVRAISHPSQIQPGAQLGYAESGIGYYSFRPKEWSELTQTEKSSVINDPRLQAFIISNRNSTIYPAHTNGPKPTLDEQLFPVNGVTPQRGEPTKSINDFYQTKAEPSLPLTRNPIIVKIPPHELVRDIEYDIFIEKVD